MTVIPNDIAFTSPPLVLSQSANGAEIGVTIRRQDRGNWCWAAVTEGLEIAFGLQPARTQCQIVSDVLGTGPCCPPGTDAQRCNVPNAPQPALGDLFEARVEAADGGTSFPFVEHEIVQRRLPVLANLGVREGRVGHLVVISGFRRAGPFTRLIVWDPYTGLRSVEELEHFQRAFRDVWQWRASYRLKRPTPVILH